MKISIVDDCKAFRKGLKTYLVQELMHEVIAEASNGEEALLSSKIVMSDIIFMDIIMGELDGFETSKKMLWNYPFVKLIAISMHSEKVFLTRLIEAGFKGFVSKNEYYNKLPDAIRTVSEGGYYFPEDQNLAL